MSIWEPGNPSSRWQNQTDPFQFQPDQNPETFVEGDIIIVWGTFYQVLEAYPYKYSQYKVLDLKTGEIIEGVSGGVAKRADPRDIVQWRQNG